MEHEQQDHLKAKKKLNPVDRENNGAIFMLRCSELGLTRAEDLDQYTVGMIYDLLTEQANDREKYPIKAAPGSLKSFFAGGGKLAESNPRNPRGDRR